MYMQFDNMPTLDPNNQRPLNLFERSNIEISPSTNLSNFPFTFDSTVPAEDGMAVDNNSALNNAFNFNASDLWGLSFEAPAFKATAAFPAAENAPAQPDMLGADPLKSFIEQANTAARINRLNQLHQVMFNNITQTGAAYVPEDNYSVSSQNDSPTTQNQSSPDYILHFPEFEDIEMNEEQQPTVAVKVEKTEQHFEEGKSPTSAASTPSTASSSSSPINLPPTTTTTQQPKKKESLLEKIVKIEKAVAQQPQTQPKKRGRKPKKDYDYIQDDEEEQMKEEQKEESKATEGKRSSQSSSSGDDDDEEKYETTDVGLKLLKRGKKRSRTEEQIDRDRLEQLLKKKNSQLTKKEKEEKRVLRNRFTAKISREKRKQENQELVQQNVKLAEENQKLKDDLKSLKEENADLKKKLQQSQYLLSSSSINATTGSEMRSGGISLFSVSILVILSLGIFIYPFIIAARVSGTTGLEVLKESNQRIELLLAKMKANIQNSQYHWNQSTIIQNAEDKKVKVKSRTLKACKTDDLGTNKKELIHHLKTNCRFMKVFRHRSRRQKQEQEQMIEINPQKPLQEDKKKNKKNRWDRFYNDGDEEVTNNEPQFVINPKTQISLFFPKFTPIDFSNISKNDYFLNSRRAQFGSNI